MRLFIERGVGLRSWAWQQRPGIFQIPPDDLPDQLYDYFAEELYRNASLSLREALHRLSLVPSAGIGVARLSEENGSRTSSMGAFAWAP